MPQPVPQGTTSGAVAPPASPAGGDAGQDAFLGPEFGPEEVRAAFDTASRTARLNETGGDAMQGAFLGPEFGPEEIRAALDAAGARYETLGDEALIAATVEALAAGKAVGWFQGRMEFGPRALGNRSILADARSPTMQKTLNLKIKYRESFRPFAPSVPRADVADWFELDRDSPYMLLVAGVNPARPPRRGRDAEQRPVRPRPLNVPRSEVPAVTHVDYSARVQTVHPETNPRYHALLEAFKAKTGCRCW